MVGTAGDAALKNKWVEKTPQPFSTLPAILRCLPLAETGEPRRYQQRCQHPSPCGKWSSVPFLHWRQNLHPLLGQDPAFCQSRSSRSREGVPGAQRWIISVRSGCYSGTRVASGGNSRVWFSQNPPGRELDLEKMDQPLWAAEEGGSRSYTQCSIANAPSPLPQLTSVRDSLARQLSVCISLQGKWRISSSQSILFG